MTTSDAGIKCNQGIFGLLLYYARAVNNKLLTTNTMEAVDQLLDYYVANYPDDGATFWASHMILAVHYSVA